MKKWLLLLAAGAAGAWYWTQRESASRLAGQAAAVAGRVGQAVAGIVNRVGEQSVRVPQPEIVSEADTVDRGYQPPDDSLIMGEMPDTSQMYPEALADEVPDSYGAAVSGDERDTEGPGGAVLTTSGIDQTMAPDMESFGAVEQSVQDLPENQGAGPEETYEEVVEEEAYPIPNMDQEYQMFPVDTPLSGQTDEDSTQDMAGSAGGDLLTPAATNTEQPDTQTYGLGEQPVVDLNQAEDVQVGAADSDFTEPVQAEQGTGGSAEQTITFTAGDITAEAEAPSASSTGVVQPTGDQASQEGQPPLLNVDVAPRSDFSTETYQRVEASLPPETIEAIQQMESGQLEEEADYPIEAGFDVMATDGKVGTVAQVVRPEGPANNYLVVKAGLLFRRDVNIPFDAIDRVENGVVYLNIDKAYLKELEGRTETVHSDTMIGGV